MQGPLWQRIYNGKARMHEKPAQQSSQPSVKTLAVKTPDASDGCTPEVIRKVRKGLTSDNSIQLKCISGN
jgi:hypothetical protein